MLTRSGKLLRNLPDLVEHYRNQKDGLPVLLAGSCTYFDPPQQPPDTYINFVRSQSRRATRKEGDYENTRTNISSTTAKHPRTADPKTQEQLYENSSDSPYENARDAIDEAGWCKSSPPSNTQAHTDTYRHTKDQCLCFRMIALLCHKLVLCLLTHVLPLLLWLWPFLPLPCFVVCSSFHSFPIIPTFRGHGGKLHLRERLGPQDGNHQWPSTCCDRKTQTSCQATVCKPDAVSAELLC